MFGARRLTQNFSRSYTTNARVVPNSARSVRTSMWIGAGVLAIATGAAYLMFSREVHPLFFKSFLISFFVVVCATTSHQLLASHFFPFRLSPVRLQLLLRRRSLLLTRRSLLSTPLLTRRCRVTAVQTLQDTDTLFSKSQPTPLCTALLSPMPMMSWPCLYDQAALYFNGSLF